VNLCNKGDFVSEYFGRAVSATNLKKYGGIGMYSMKVGQKIINGNMEKNTAMFINHSCNPNCILDVRTIRGKNHACIFAAKKIKKGSESTFDYSWNSIDGEVKTQCQCGAKKYCKGYI
jgi:histone-lysine N-methyltransferase SETD2